MKTLREVQLERDLAGAKDATDIKIIMDAYSQDEGRLIRNVDGLMVPNVVPANSIAPTPSGSQNAEQPTDDKGVLRKVVRTPSGKVICLEARSFGGLDILEQAALAGRLG